MTATIAPPTPVATHPEQRIVLNHVSWETYEQLLANFEDRSAPRLAYDRGVLEIVSPSAEHEADHLALAKVVETVAEELEIDYRPVGSTTFRRKRLKQGFEADSSFYVRDQRFSRDLASIDPNVDPPPNLVIEVDVAHSSLNKLAIYAAFGVPEVWRAVVSRVAIFVLEGDRYREVAESNLLPPLTSEILTRFLLGSRTKPRLAWIREVRSWCRAKALRAPTMSSEDEAAETT